MNEDDIWGKWEVARYLGCHPSALKGYRKRADNPLPAILKGKVWIYPRVEIIQWCEEEEARSVRFKNHRRDVRWKRGVKEER